MASMILEERVEIYTGIFNRNRFLGYEDIITANLLPNQICEPNDSIEVLAGILRLENITFFINGDPVTSIGSGGYGYEPDDTCMDISSATAQVNTRLALGFHIVTVRIRIPTQSRTIEYTRAFEVVRGSAEQ